MRAAVYQGSQKFDIEDRPDPTPGPGQVVVDVIFCAICGTDVHAFLYDVAPPGTVMGHEYSGTISGWLRRNTMEGRRPGNWRRWRASA